MTRLFVRLLLILLWLICAGTANARKVSVFAASSLTEVLREIAQSYETEHPGERILLNFAGSQALATQIEQGAAADLFISADQPVMERLQKQGLVGKVRSLLANRLVLAVREDLQPPLTNLKDLVRPNLLLVIGNRSVPVGNYTRKMLAGLEADPAFGRNLVTEIEANVVSEENRVKAIIAKLLLGEADAGIVYQSDLAVGDAGRLNAIPVPQQHNPLAVYPMAAVRGNDSVAAGFINFIQSHRVWEVFARYGFLPPEGS